LHNRHELRWKVGICTGKKAALLKKGLGNDFSRLSCWKELFWIFLSIKLLNF